MPYMFSPVDKLDASDRLPSRELTYPTLGKGKMPFWGDMLVPWRVVFFVLAEKNCPRKVFSYDLKPYVGTVRIFNICNPARTNV